MGFRHGRRRAWSSGRGSRSSVWLAAIAVALLAVPAAQGDPPTTSITVAPAPLTPSPSASFQFVASDPAATFECKLDGAVFAPCASPAAYGPLADGAHAFAVRGTTVGPDGGTGADATHAWTIDATPPAAPTITGGPVGTVLVAVANLTFTADGAAQCALDGGAFAACTSPHPLTGLSDGAHSFVVRAVDGAGNISPSSAAWTWTVDATAPGAPVITGGPTGTVATATATLTFVADGTAECSLDAAIFAACTSPHQLAGLADGAHGFRVRAVDAAGNRSPASTPRTWTVDTTPPPSPTITGGPTGTVATVTASITFQAQDTPQCSLDGGAFAGCASPHQLAGLSDGAHSFAVRAIDVVGNQSAASARAWVVDTTKPSLSLPPGVTAEADGPGGSVVQFQVSAVDHGAPLPPAAIQCAPRSGAQFALGRTTVGCAATDPVGNRTENAFTVIVRDTTPPAINAPDVTVTAPRAAGIRRTDAALATYLNGVRATDLVSTPTVTNDAAVQLPVGRTRVTFTARDGAGNTATSAATITVLQPGSAAPPVDVRPPADVPGVKVVAGDHSVTITWSRPARDVAAVAVYRNRAGRAGSGTLIYRGTNRKVVDRRLANGVQYRYVVAAFDGAGNRSRGVVRLARPAALLLLAPRPNARMSTPPLLRWTGVGSASYYNVQIWRANRKILSSWPAGTQLRMPRSWRFEGRRYRLTPGVYTWYVWPGLGAKASARYGTMLGRSTFVIAPPV